MTAPKPFAVAWHAAHVGKVLEQVRAYPWPPAPEVDDGWAYGCDADYLHRLCDHWLDGYDWRAAVHDLNRYPQFTARIEDFDIHFVHVIGEAEGRRPLILSHGWPGSHFEFWDAIDKLAWPSRHGGDAADAFDLVIPSLPGFGFSPQRPSFADAQQTHELWHRLMREELGFERYGGHGGDLGAGITSRLAEAYPAEVVGIHLLAAGPVGYDAASLTPEEQTYLEEVSVWQQQEGGYQHEQGTRPLTLGYGLADSPAGLLAWILEKYRAWSDCGGEVSTRFSDDFLLTQASLYWFTETISTSFRPYYEYATGMTRRVERVEVPTALALFPADLSHPPRSWVERTYRLVRYTRMPRGGHFAPHEEPELLAADLTEFFRALR